MSPFRAAEPAAPAAEAPRAAAGPGSDGGLGEPAAGSSEPSSTKNLVWAAITVAVLYYGWPIIEAVILILPIPNATGVVDTIKAAGNSAQDVVASVMKSDTKRRNGGPSSDYQ